MSDAALRDCDLAVTGATVLPFDAAWSVHADCDLVASGRCIAALGRGAARGYRPRRTVDGHGLVVIPGLCNAHTHSPEVLGRGLAGGARLDEWREAVWAGLDALDEPALETAVLLAAAEMLHGGVTAVVDHFRQTPISAAAIDAAARAWQRTGMRVTLAIMVRDRAARRGRTQPDADAQLELVRRAARRWHGVDDRLQIAVGPSAPTRCTDRLLERVAELARAAGLRVHMHADETRAEAELARELYGTSAVRHLDRIGALGPEVSLAHAVWVVDEDIERLTATRTGVVHNPISNLRLGSGRAPVERFLARGVRVALGTDGAGSNDTQSVLETVKLATLLPRVAIDDAAHWPPPQAALAMATATPAALFGMGAGRLAPGAPADFVAFDRDAAPLLPPNDLHCQIALAGASLRARYVAVAGELLLDEGRILAFDETALGADARRIGSRRAATAGAGT